jgi:hypothetical protein
MRWRKHSLEVLAQARRLYDSGLPLSKVSIEVKVPYATLHYHAWVQGWMRPKGEGRIQAAGMIRRRLKKEEQRLNEQLAITKSQDIEVLARKSLVADSARTKLAVSRQVGKILNGLEEDATMSLREKARTLNARGPIIKLLHRWDAEPDLDDMQRARGAINLPLIHTTPEQLRSLSEGRKAE